MTIKKTLTISFILFAIGFSSVALSLVRLPQKTLQQKLYKVQITPYSLIFDSANSKNSFKVSPFDDYFYQGTDKNHFIKDSNFQQSRNLVNELRAGNDLIWSINKDKMEITYEIVPTSSNTASIQRKFENLPSSVTAVGQAIAFCKECFVSNEDQTLVYLREDMITPEMLDNINKLHLVPLVVKEQLPISISKLIILDQFGEKKLELEVSSEQEVYFLQDWNILEIKTPISNPKLTIVSQTVRFF